MKKIVLFAVALISMVGLLVQAHAEKTVGSMVYFRSGDTTLRGYLYRPDGSGPYPAVVYVRAANKPFSEAEPPMPEIGEFYTSRGFAVFVPMLRTGDELRAEANGVQVKGNGKKHKLRLPEYNVMTKDIAAAVTWLKSQSFVNENRVAVIGHGSGAVGALLLSQQDVEVSGYVIFSPAVQAWKEKPEVASALTEAVRESKAPIFLIQAQNDWTLAPSEVLGRELMAKGKPNTSKVYPPFGTGHPQAFAFANRGSAVWGSDVISFLRNACHI